MKIHNIGSPTGIQGSEQPKSDQPGASRTPAATESARAHIDSLSHDGGSDIDSARVEEVKQAIIEGRLSIDSEKIADALLAGARDLLRNGSE